MVQVYDNLCAEGLTEFITGFTLSRFCVHTPALSSEDYEFFLRNLQYVISSNNVVVLCVCSSGINKRCSVGYVVV